MNMEKGEQALQRGLSIRHIQMIGLGGAIGTGLFLGSAGVIKSAGPALLIGYALAGIIAFWMMRQLGEMLVDEPVSGNLSYFAQKYSGGFLGYLSGWNYVATYILVGMAELTAVGKYMNYWWPELPTWLSAAGFFIIINFLNLLNVRIYGESEFWFAIIKVLAILAMIIFGAWMVFGPTPQAGASISNLWSHGGFMPHGWMGLLMAMPFIMFAFGGLEMIGFTAGEARNPQTSIPAAINQVLYRIGIFYIGALSILLMLMPWDSLVASLTTAGDPYSASPFVKVLSILDSNVAAGLLNFVVLAAALSVYNAIVYCNSRQLYAMAKQGNASKLFLKLNKNHIPINALAVTAVITGLTILLNYLPIDNLIGTLMALTVATTVMNWFLTSYVHLRFKAVKASLGQKTSFLTPFFPVSNYLCMAFIVVLLVTMILIPETRISIWMIPVWLLVIFVLYRKKNTVSQTVIENHKI